MIIIKNLTKDILGETLFKEVSFVLRKGDKVGLVGPNGCGKSTLLKIILGQVEADGGDVRVEHENIGYLPQELLFKSSETVGSFLSVSGNPKEKQALDIVGLGNIPRDIAVNKLSGGQKTRLSLAGILLGKPSALLLDEPTNHLDLKGLEWLENFIRDFRGGVLIVSHDRRLLDNSANKILEIDAVNHKFAEYAGGYTEYALEKEKKLARWEDEYERQQKKKRRMELWLALKRQEAHSSPDPAKGRQIRAMEKRLQREIYNQEIQRPKSQKKINDLELEGEAASAKLMVRAKNIAKSFPGKDLLRGVSFELRGREHVLLAGDNGSGKTTLLKILTGDLQPDSGELRLGENVRFGYFAQEHEILNPDKTVMEEFLSTDRLLHSSRDPRAILGAFLFSGQNAFKKVSSLSLGERVRLIFTKLTNQENELLILDEPTNHLDIQSREVIEDALLGYKGAILVVSHDRYFLDKISIHRTLTIQNRTIKEKLV
jgi:ATPase subunit of ABC transporter with duplicated ATPase domains